MSDKMLTFRVTTVGNSKGFILPRERAIDWAFARATRCI